MGMYTELHFNAELKADIPSEVLETLRFMLSDEDAEEDLAFPNHPLFKTDRWRWMLCCDSYYFPAQTRSELYRDGIFGTANPTYYLCIRCNLKNYKDEIEHFIDWIDQYLDHFPGDFLGFSRYEESEVPNLIFKKGQ